MKRHCDIYHGVFLFLRKTDNLLTGAAAMHLDNGYGAYVFRDSDTSLEVYPIEEPDVAVMLAKDIQRDYIDVMNEE